MYAQVVHATVAPQSFQELQDLLKNWVSESAVLSEEGAEVMILQNLGQETQCTILLLFPSQGGLDRFSANPDAVKFFMAARDHVESEIDYYEAAVTRLGAMATT
jgi:hypothetical protein